MDLGDNGIVQFDIGNMKMSRPGPAAQNYDPNLPDQSEYDNLSGEEDEEDKNEDSDPKNKKKKPSALLTPSKSSSKILEKNKEKKEIDKNVRKNFLIKKGN